MRVSSELPLSAESVPSYPGQRAQRQPANREYVGDEEFPADLPVEHDRLLQPVSGHGFRRVGRLSAVTLALLLLGFTLWGAHQFSKLTLALGIALAVVIIAAACRVVLSVLGGARSEPVWRDLPRPTFHLES